MVTSMRCCATWVARLCLALACVGVTSAMAAPALADPGDGAYEKSAVFVTGGTSSQQNVAGALTGTVTGPPKGPVCTYGNITQALLDDYYRNMGRGIEGTGGGAEDTGVSLEEAQASEDPLYRSLLCDGQPARIAFIEMPPPEKSSLPGAIDVAALRLRAYSKVPLPAPRVAMNPDGRDVSALIDLPIWFGVDKSAGRFSGATASAAATGTPVSMRVKIVPSSITITASTGQTVRCNPAKGAVWRPGASPAAACTMTFDKAHENLTFTVTTAWEASWELLVNGAPVRAGSDGTVSSYTTLSGINVHERHVLNTVNGARSAPSARSDTSGE